MSNIKLCFLQNKDKGLTLIELIVALGIATLIIVPLISILILSMKSSLLVEEREELMLNGNYAIEYMKSGIKSADKIIASNKIKNLTNKYPTNIGFVVKIEGETKEMYHTYHIKDDKLVRIACEFERGTYVNGKYPNGNSFKGFNTICEFVKNIDSSNFNIENSIINLNLELAYSNSRLDLKSDVYIRCEIDY